MEKKILLIKSYISNFELEKAFKMLREIGNSDELISIHAQYSHFKSEKNKGVISEDEKNLRINKIIDSLLNFINDFGKIIGKEKLSDIENKKNSEIQLGTIITPVNVQIKVGVFGKKNSGKSFLCYSLANKNKDNGLYEQTSIPNRIKYKLNKGSVIVELVEPLGFTEKSLNEKSIKELYLKISLEINTIFLVIRADFTSLEEEKKLLEFINPNQEKATTIILTMIDILEDSFEWNENANKPSENQLSLINIRIDQISRFFDIPKKDVIPVSAIKKYNIHKINNPEIE